MVRSRYIVGLILLIFFVMSFLTNIPGGDHSGHHYQV